MRKIFSISRKQATIFIILGALALGALWYYFDYIPNNERTLDEQHFRWLQKTDENIRAKINGFDTLLSNFLNTYLSNNSLKDDSLIRYRDSVKKYISTYTISGVAFSLHVLRDTGKSKPHSINIDSAAIDSDAIVFELKWDSLTDKLTFVAGKKDTLKKQYCIVTMTTDFGEFISPLLTSGLFEHYVVFDNGKYIYEDFHSGLGYNFKNEDSLLATGKNMTGANILQQKVGGIDYQMFLQPINFFSNGRLIIAGLISQKNINAEKKQLPAGFVILAIIIALGILLFLPWIKIYFQGKYDKIYLRDAAASAIVAKLLISLVVLLFFAYNYAFRPDTEEDSQNFLADTITASFKKEINSAFTCLQYFDSIALKQRMFYDIKNLGKETVEYNTGQNMFFQKYSSTSAFNLKTCPIKYNEVNWLDNNGTLKYGWTTDKRNNIHANYSYRPYYKNIITGNTISICATPVVIDQIVSRTSGAFTTVISKSSVLDTDSLKKKDSSAKVVALSFTMKSLDSVIMPAGYSFAIIDENGDVKYHSQHERNLNENLRNEFTDSEELKDALIGRFTERFITKYYEDTYSVLVKPIKDLPYFIVIMSDQSFPDSVQIETFSFTWGMILLFLLVVVIDLFIVIVASSRRSLFKKQYFVTSWLWPRKCSANEYNTTALANLIMIAVLVVTPLLLRHFFDYLSYLFVLFFCIPISTFFMNTLFLCKYRREQNDVYVNYKVNCNRGTLAFLIVLNVFAMILLANIYWHVLLFEIAAGVALFIFFRQYKKRKPTSTNDKSKGFIIYYVRMIFTRLIITSAIPAVFFYIVSYNYENNLLSRYRKYDFSERLQQKFAGRTYDTATFNAVYPDNIWIKSIGKGRPSSATDTLKPSQKNTASLFNAFGFYLEDIATVNNDNFYKSFSDDKSVYFNNFFSSVLYGGKDDSLFTDNKILKPSVDLSQTFSTDTFNYSYPYINHSAEPSSFYNIYGYFDSILCSENLAPKHLVISSQNLNYTSPWIDANNGFMFWALLLLVLYCFYLVLIEVIKKVCSLNLTSITLLKNAGITTGDLIAKETEPLLWIIGLPADEAIEQVKAKMKNAGAISTLNFNDIIIDNKKTKDASIPFTQEGIYVIQLKAAENKNNKWEEIKSAVKNAQTKFVLIVNIENNLDDEAVSKEKLKCIKELLDDGKKIRIVTTMHPLKMLEILNRTKDETTTPSDTAIARLMYLSLENAPIVILPLIKNNLNKVTKTGIAPVDLFLDKELLHTKFLKHLYAPSLLTNEEKTTAKFREDKITLRIQFLANNFYMSIWRSLSSDEKFILYDLAADGLVNISNTAAMNLLMSKGLIVEEEGNLHIFSRSFRNFILTSVDSKELDHLQMLHNKHSNWSNLQTPLLIVVVVVLVFLAIAQEGLYSRVIAIISSIAAGIPALLKILSMFGTTNTRDVRNTPQE